LVAQQAVLVGRQQLDLIRPFVMEADRVVVTGASGFIGGAVAARLVKDQHLVVTPVRNPSCAIPAGVHRVPGPDLGPIADWDAAIGNARAIVHCAARVHVLHERTLDPLATFRQANVDGTLKLAQQAADRGVQRFVFVSSIGVNGVETTDRPFTAEDPAAPLTPYAVSKHEAERALGELSQRTGMQTVIVRPPLVYGPSAPGNFRTLLDAIRSGVPLPFGSIDNRRSFVAIANLVDLIALAIDHPAAAGQILVVSDGSDFSTPELVRILARAMHRPARLFPVPPRLLEWGAVAIGRPELARQLCRSLQVDSTRTRRLLGWTPPRTAEEALQAAVR
jgi:nucleoside-diphosphate-sugar epimerase